MAAWIFCIWWRGYYSPFTCGCDYFDNNENYSGKKGSLKISIPVVVWQVRVTFLLNFSMNAGSNQARSPDKFVFFLLWNGSRNFLKGCGLPSKPLLNHLPAKITFDIVRRFRSIPSFHWLLCLSLQSHSAGTLLANRRWKAKYFRRYAHLLVMLPPGRSGKCFSL